MNILFLGGTKFFGKLIVEELMRQGHVVTVISRQEGPCNFRVIGDRNDPETLRQVRSHYDTIIDNIAYGPEDPKAFFDSGITTDHYIVTSSIASYYPDVSEYSARKLELEKYLWKSDIPWTIMRPGIVYGSGDPLAKTLWYLNQSIPPLHDRRISFVFSEDLPDAYISVLENPDYICQDFDLCHPQTLSIEEFVQFHCVWHVQGYWDSTEGPYYYKNDFIGHPAYAMEVLKWKPTAWEKAIEKTLPWIKEELKCLKWNSYSSGTASGTREEA